MEGFNRIVKFVAFIFVSLTVLTFIGVINGWMIIMELVTIIGVYALIYDANRVFFSFPKRK